LPGRNKFAKIPAIPGKNLQIVLDWQVGTPDRAIFANRRGRFDLRFGM
jgi:hypothetical protein